MKNFSIVVAMDEARGIGKEGRLAWNLPADLKHFKTLTSTVNRPNDVNAVIMGRKTWESLPEKFRPLPGRLNVVLSSQPIFAVPDAAVKCSALPQALEYIGPQPQIEKIFVIGGAQLYAQAINHPQCAEIVATCLKGDFQCDAFFPAIPGRFRVMETTPWSSDAGISYRIAVYKTH